MNEFIIIYRILKRLEDAMETDNFDTNSISYEELGVNKILWGNVIELLVENEYVKGIGIFFDNDAFHDGVEKYVDISRARITLKGLEYLHENRTIDRARTMCGVALKFFQKNFKNPVTFCACNSLYIIEGDKIGNHVPKIKSVQ